jgi:GNAT superfamily N-acetyltransferase
MTDSPFRIRDARPSDLAFVTDAWLNSYRVRLLAKIEREVRNLTRTATVKIACHRQDDDALCGFAAMSDGALHYTYVKEALRGEGIARALIEPENIGAYTFSTDNGISRIRPHERGWEYRPRIQL